MRLRRRYSTPSSGRRWSESELVTYEIARSTAGRAVAWLRDQNLIETVPAKSSYVL